MTPLSLQLAMPVVQVIGAGVIMSRIPWRDLPALTSLMCSEAFFQGLSFGGVPLPSWALWVRVMVIAAVSAEVLAYARVEVSRELRGRAVALALATAAFLASLAPGLTPMQRVYLFRSYFLLAPCAVIVGAAIVRHINPVLEPKRVRAYRLGAVAWILNLTIAGAFVKGGLGYRILPYTLGTWQTVNLASYAALILTVSGMSLAMWLSVRPKRRGAGAMAAPQVSRVVAIARRAA